MGVLPSRAFRYSRTPFQPRSRASNLPVRFGPDFPAHLKDKIVKALVDFAASEACADSICSDKFYSWTGVEPIGGSAYDPIRKLIKVLGYTEEDIFKKWTRTASCG
jgi:hypothetical protein